VTDTPLLGITPDEARSVLHGSPFASWWGLRVERIGAGTATVHLPTAPRLLRPGGVLQGACYEVAADVAIWLAIMTVDGPDTRAVTLEMKTNFLRSTAGDLTSTGRILHAGRSVVVGTADTVDQVGRLVAHSIVTYTRPVAPASR
jgi:uncharacterized protein (TIGR00369 family)